MAELLVRAKGHWRDSTTQKEIDAMTPEQLKDFNSRSQFGDIIVVREDGWVWGNEECLPNFIVVKLPGLSVEESKIYEESLMLQDGLDENNEPNMYMTKVRKYQVPLATVQAQVDLEESVLEIPLGHGEGVDPISDFQATIIEKTS